MRPLFYCCLMSIFSLAIIPSSGQPAAWKSVGVGGGGALFSPSISPHNADEVYLACDMSEQFHSMNFGLSWDVVNFRQLTADRNSEVQFTEDPNILYAINNDGDFIRPAKSIDGGKTWTVLGNDPTEGETYALKADPDNHNRIILSSYGELFFSSDGGQSFTQKGSSPDGYYIAGVFWDGNTIYIGTAGGVVVSDNGGASFAAPLKNGIPADELIVSFAGAKQDNTTRFYCVTLGDGDVYPGVTGSDHYDYQSVYHMDVGSPWEEATYGIETGDHPFFVTMAPHDIHTAYLAGGSDNSTPIVYQHKESPIPEAPYWASIFHTENNNNIATGWSGQGGDRAWSYGEYALGFTTDPKGSGRLVITDLGFAHVGIPHGTGEYEWHQAYVNRANENAPGTVIPKGKSYAGVGLENTTCWQVTWLAPDHLFASFSDINGIRSEDGGKTWSFNYTGSSPNSTYYVSKHPTTGVLYRAVSSLHDMYQSTTIYDEKIDKATGGILFSTNGQQWQVLYDFKHPAFWLAHDPANANRMYASVIHSTEGGIYRTDNLQDGAGSTWTKLPNPPRTEGHPATVRVLNDGTVVCTFSARRTTEFTASSGVFVWNPVTQEWADRSDPGMQYWTKDIIIDPHDLTQNTWYVAVFSGWGGAPNGLGGLYKTTDRGQSWKKINTLDRVTSCTIHPVNPDEMYLTTETDGLWYCKNLSSASPTFTSVESYPFRQPERVFYNPSDPDEVWVTSFGNGMRVGHMLPNSVGEHTTETPSLQVFPNPAHDNLMVQWMRPAQEGATLKLFTVLGTPVFSAVLPRGSMEKHIDVAHLPTGLYILRLEQGETTTVLRVNVLH